MADYNFVVLTGRATKEPALRHKASGQLKVELSLEVERPFRRVTGEAVSDLFLVDVWGDLAYRFADRIHAGTTVLLIGTLNKESFVTRHGHKEHLTVIKAKYIRILENGVASLPSLDWESIKLDSWSDEVIADYLEAVENNI
ncbi:MAG TPA: single-stranded DNA-binding protein [Armatimonadetes bacterium]|nr:single-stranded DNA-binding protein [Armatimonadota bacterium]